MKTIRIFNKRNKIYWAIALATVGLSLPTTFIIASCSQKLSMKIVDGEQNGLGYLNTAGSLTQFSLKYNKETSDDHLCRWSIVSDEHNSDLSCFKIDQSGKVKWTSAIVPGSYYFNVKAEDDTSHLHATTNLITVNILSETPPTPVKKVECKGNPTNYNFENNPANNATDFTYDIDETAKTAIITGWSDTYNNAISAGGTGIVKPAESYTNISTANPSEAYKIIGLGDMAFSRHYKPQIKATTIIIDLPATIETIGDWCFDDQDEDSNVPGEVQLFINLSRCSNVDVEFESQRNGTKTTDPFAHSIVKAFIPPLRNDVLQCMWDDMFEQSYMCCDIDYSSFTKLKNLGHWSTRFDMDNSSLDPSGATITKAVGRFVIPNTVTTVGWAGFCACEINEVYWDTQLSSITFDDSNEFYVPPSIFGMFNSALIHKLYIPNSSTEGPLWKQKIESYGEVPSWLARFVGPHNGPAKLEQWFDYPV